MAIPDQCSVNLWDQFWGKINLTIDGDAKFQIVYPFIEWTWPKSPEPGYIDKSTYSILGQMPVWSAIGEYRPSASDLYQNYCEAILACPRLTIQPELEENIEEANKVIEQAYDKLQQDTERKNTAWVQTLDGSHPELPPPDYNEWMQTSGWQAILDKDGEAVINAADAKAELVNEQNMGYSEAIATAKMPTIGAVVKPGFAKCEIDGSDQWRANYITEWSKESGHNSNLHLELSNDTTTFMKESWAGGACDYGTFFSVNENGTWQDLPLTEEDPDVKVNIDIRNVTTVPVLPDQWYDSKYLSLLAEKDYWNSPFTTTGGESPVFGKGGMLSLRITGMVVGYDPSVTVIMSIESQVLTHLSETMAARSTSVHSIRAGSIHFPNDGETNWFNIDPAKKTFLIGPNPESNASSMHIIGFTVACPGIEE